MCFSWFYGSRPPCSIMIDMLLRLLQRGAACPPLHSPRVFFMVLWLAPSIMSPPANCPPTRQQKRGADAPQDGGLSPACGWLPPPAMLLVCPNEIVNVPALVGLGS